MTKFISMPEFKGFDWSGQNAEKNWQHHQVTASESERVFFNHPLLIADDVEHSSGEIRYYALGQTDQGRELFTAFTMREKLIRVISSRDMSRKERGVYRSS